MTEESTFIMTGSISATIVAFLQAAVLRMIPYAVPGLFLIVLDLIFGCKAAICRGEKVRLSTAIRRTMLKTFEYLCFIVLASTLALAFSKAWLEWVVLGLVYLNEFLSIIGNHLETKGITLSLVGVFRWFVKWITGKAGAVMSDEEAAEIIKPKPARDAKGRFIKKEDK